MKRRPLPGLGDIRLAARTRTQASADQLTALALDLDRYVAVEPRLRSARLLGGAEPQAGSRIEITAEIPFTVSVVRAVMGHPTGIVTILGLEPSRELALSFEAARFTGQVTVVLSREAQHTLVQVDGSARPRSRVAQLALLPVKPVIEELAERSILRAIRRIDTAATEASERRTD